MSKRGVFDVSAPTEFKIVDDRLHVTIFSGPDSWTFAFKFHRARNDAHVAIRSLDERDRQPSNVKPFTGRSKKAPPEHA